MTFRNVVADRKGYPEVQFLATLHRYELYEQFGVELRKEVQDSPSGWDMGVLAFILHQAGWRRHSPAEERLTIEIALIERLRSAEWVQGFLHHPESRRARVCALRVHPTPVWLEFDEDEQMQAEGYENKVANAFDRREKEVRQKALAQAQAKAEAEEKEDA